MKRLWLLMLIVVIGFISIPAHSAPDTPQKKVEKKIIIKKKGLKLGLVLSSIHENQSGSHAPKQGAYVLKVLENSPADKAGLKKGDIITEISGTTIKKPQDVIDLISGLKDGETIDIKVLRNGNEKKLRLTIEEFEPEEMVWLPEVEELSGRIHKIIPELKEKMKKIRVNLKGGYLGVEVEELTAQLKEYFEVKNGVLIKNVIKNSPAEKAGLKAGDVITEISGKKIEDYQDLVRVVNYYDPGDKVTVKVKRKGKNKEFTVELGKKPGPKWLGKHHSKSIEHMGEMLENIEIPDIEIDEDILNNKMIEQNDDTIIIVL